MYRCRLRNVHDFPIGRHHEYEAIQRLEIEQYKVSNICQSSVRFSTNETAWECRAIVYLTPRFCNLELSRSPGDRSSRIVLHNLVTSIQQPARGTGNQVTRSWALVRLDWRSTCSSPIARTVSPEDQTIYSRRGQLVFTTDCLWSNSLFYAMCTACRQSAHFQLLLRYNVYSL